MRIGSISGDKRPGKLKLEKLPLGLYNTLGL